MIIHSEYTLPFVINLMNQISKQYKIKLIILTETQTKKNHYDINHAYSTNDEIIMAHFTLSTEYILIAFFHELSHILNFNKVKNCSLFNKELTISIEAINFAQNNYHLKFSDNCIKWLIEQSFTYLNK